MNVGNVKGQFLFISGGNTTEILNSDGMVTWGPKLPNELIGHCAVTAKDGRVILSGGMRGSSRRQVWIYDWNTQSFSQSFSQSSFTQGPDMKNDHHFHCCALFKSNFHNGREVLLVAGGDRQDTTEVWDYQTPGSSWTSSKWEFCVYFSIICKKKCIGYWHLSNADIDWKMT